MRYATTSIYAPVASGSAGIWRVEACDRSIVLKVLHHAEGSHTHWQSGEDPGHWYYWRREALAYTSGLLDDLQGDLRAPHCYAAVDRADGTVALWLEDVDGVPGEQWALEQYRVAARHLGEAQGAYLVDRPLPDDAWLSRGWLRTYVAQRGEWPERAWLLDVLDDLPRTLCHLDLHPRNLFATGETTTLIDWAFVGIGALGEDAGNLVPDSVLDFFVRAEDADALFELVYEGYVEGLADAGWRGDPDVVRLAMAATSAVKYSWIAPALEQAKSEGRETLNHRSIDEALPYWEPMPEWFERMQTEARRLTTSASGGR